MMQVSVPLKPAERSRTLLRSVSPKKLGCGQHRARMASQPLVKAGYHPPVARQVAESNGYFCSLTSTLAIVFSHSSLRTEESLPVLSREIVNISSPEGRCVTVMGIRARS